MNDLYKTILGLCQKREITGYRMCKDIGIQPSIMTDLKSGRKKGLSAENANKIASYFGVSVGYLLGTEQKKEPTTKSDELDLQLEGIDFALFGEVKEMTNEQKLDVLDYIKFKKTQKKRGNE